MKGFREPKERVSRGDLQYRVFFERFLQGVNFRWGRGRGEEGEEGAGPRCVPVSPFISSFRMRVWGKEGEKGLIGKSSNRREEGVVTTTTTTTKTTTTHKSGKGAKVGNGTDRRQTPGVVLDCVPSKQTTPRNASFHDSFTKTRISLDSVRK